MKELQDNFPNLKPLIVKLIEDDNYNFITQSEFKIYLIRSNNIITSHENVKCFDINYIDFYDELLKTICNKGLIFICSYKLKTYFKLKNLYIFFLFFFIIPIKNLNAKK